MPGSSSSNDPTPDCRNGRRIAAILKERLRRIRAIDRRKLACDSVPAHRKQLFEKEAAIMDLDPSVRAAMLAAIPHLRAFAISLCRNPERADDLVQETLLRACANIAQFQHGTKMEAWLATILRNQHYSEYRKRRREVEDADGIYAKTLVTHPSQLASAQYNELRTALARLPDEMREALLLVVGSGLSYPEVARICGCAVGTIKSRVHRARERLAAMLFVESPSDLAEDAIGRSIVAAAEHGRFAVH
jgi:RNA polymerase sigma-70 factor, ECF subfamily